MPYRVKPDAPLVCARNQLGKVVYYYANPGTGMSGPMIPWLTDDQAAYLLRCNMIEPVDDPEPPTPSAIADDTAEDRVRQCAAALDELEVPATAGAPRARDALREGNRRFSNDVIAAAVKARKESSSRKAVS